MFFTLSDSFCCVDLISQSTQYYWKQVLTAGMGACSRTAPSRLGTVGDPFPSLSVTHPKMCHVDCMYQKISVYFPTASHQHLCGWIVCLWQVPFFD